MFEVEIFSESLNRKHNLRKIFYNSSLFIARKEIIYLQEIMPIFFRQFVGLKEFFELRIHIYLVLILLELVYEQGSKNQRFLSSPCYILRISHEILKNKKYMLTLSFYYQPLYFSYFLNQFNCLFA